MMTMLEGLKGENCPRNCWIAGGVVGLVVLILAMVLFGASFLAGLFFGIVLGAGAALYLNAKLCTGGDVHLRAERAHTEVAPAPPPKPDPAAAPKPAPAPAAAKAEAPKPAAPRPAETKPAAKPPAAAGAGTKPATLSAPRAGGPDDLKRIKGVGPKLEKLLNGMGFYHFDQIAGWTEGEVAWVDENLEGFKGRVSRDRWIEQAKTLALGGETEFSARVDKGDVY
jgi:predicted flap endonuclease-1-like 5' DNA nuclease